MMSRSVLASHSISTVPQEVRPPATLTGLRGGKRFSVTVSERPGPETPYWLNASAATRYGPSSSAGPPAGWIVQFVCHSSLVASEAVGALGCDVPSSVHLTTVGLLDVVIFRVRNATSVVIS